MTDLQGGCEHAAAFGELGQTLEEAWRLSEAALDVASGERGGTHYPITLPRWVDEHGPYALVVDSPVDMCGPTRFGRELASLLGWG